MYTIKHASKQVGISPATIRAWERRYAIVSPTRTEGGYRVYDEGDVNALRSMKELIDQGWTARLAADEVGKRAISGQVLPIASNEGFSSDGKKVGSDLPSQLIEAAARMDAARIGTVLDQLFSLGSFEVVMDSHLFPALHELGDAWSDGRVSVAGEHLASNAVMRRLAVAYEAAAAFGHGPRIVLGLAPNSRHEIGLLAFAVAARRRGMNTDYLGADLPVEDWLRVVEDRRPSAVVLALPTSPDVEATARVITALRAQRPELVVAVGGAAQEQAPDDAVRLGNDILSGVGTLAHAIGG